MPPTASTRSTPDQVDAMLLDVAMPRIDDRVEGLEAAADDYLPKPCALRDLLVRLKAVRGQPPGPRGGSLPRRSSWASEAAPAVRRRDVGASRSPRAGIEGRGGHRPRQRADDGSAEGVRRWRAGR